MNNHPSLIIALLLLLSQPWISLCFLVPNNYYDVPSYSGKTSDNIIRGSKMIYSKDIGSQLNMCQLMGMNCAALTDFTFSFRGFARRGGDTDVHSHGWGKKNEMIISYR